MRALKLFLFIFVISFEVFASETLTMDIGVAEIRPWFYKEDGKLKGVSFDIYESISKRSNIKFNYHLLPYKRVKLFFKKGNFDLISDLANSDVNSVSKPIGELLNVKLIILGKKENVDSLRNKEKLKKKLIVCALNGVVNILSQFDDLINIKFLNSLERCIGMLNKGRVDLVQTSLTNHLQDIERGLLKEGQYQYFEFMEIVSIIFAHKKVKSKHIEKLIPHLLNFQKYRNNVKL